MKQKTYSGAEGIMIRENGLRLEDQIVVRPVYGKLKTITLKRTLYSLGGGPQEGYFIPLGSVEEDQWFMELHFDFNASKNEDRARFYIYSGTDRPFLINGNYALSAYLQRGDKVLLGHNEIAMAPVCATRAACDTIIVGSVVDISIQILPGPISGSISASTASDAAGLGKEVITTSQPRMISAADNPPFAPQAVNSATRARSKSCTHSATPLFKRLPASLPPTAPNPMNPVCILSSSFWIPCQAPRPLSRSIATPPLSSEPHRPSVAVMPMIYVNTPTGPLQIEQEDDAIVRVKWAINAASDDTPLLREALDAISTGVFAPESPARYHSLVSNLYNNDWWMICADFEAYWNTQRQVDELFLRQDAWQSKAIHNTARMSWFSSDRSIREYAKDIWQADPGRVT